MCVYYCLQLYLCMCVCVTNVFFQAFAFLIYWFNRLESNIDVYTNNINKHSLLGFPLDFEDGPNWKFIFTH